MVGKMQERKIKLDFETCGDIVIAAVSVSTSISITWQLTVSETAVSWNNILFWVKNVKKRIENGENRSHAVDQNSVACSAKNVQSTYYYKRMGSAKFLLPCYSWCESALLPLEHSWALEGILNGNCSRP